MEKTNEFRKYISKDLGALYVLSYMAYAPNSFNFFILDTGIQYAANPDPQGGPARQEKSLHDFIRAKNSCILTKEVDRLLETLGCNFNSTKETSQLVRHLAEKEIQETSLLEISLIP